MNAKEFVEYEFFAGIGLIISLLFMWFANSKITTKGRYMYRTHQLLPRSPHVNEEHWHSAVKWATNVSIIVFIVMILICIEFLFF